MMKDSLAKGVIGLLLGIIVTGFFISYSVHTNSQGMMRMMGIQPRVDSDSLQSSRGGMMGNIDRHFIEQMIPHHEDAITMADSALEKAEHQEIKDLANNIKTSQSGEISQMQTWYKNWFSQNVPKNGTVMGGHGMGTGSMHMGMMGDDTDMEGLKDSSNFDKTFIEEMIPHHQMAVMMADMLLASTNRPEMKKLAQDIISAQTKEINEMREWARAWGYRNEQ